MPARASEGLRTHPPARRPASDDFLLEIGCEELPADYLPLALNWGESGGGLPFSAACAFSGNKIGWQEIWTYGTPRRLVLWVKGVEPVINKSEEGPPVQIAFDSQGKPTRAAESFAQRHGLKISQLKRKQTAKGERLCAEYDVPVTKILTDLIPVIIKGIGFPKTMRWDESGVRFARPIRWLLALYGSKPVSVLFGRIKSGKTTYGTRRCGGKAVVISTPASYFPTLTRLKVHLEEGLHYKSKGDSFEPLPSHPRKREELLKRLAAAAKRCAGRLADETTEEFGWLLSTSTFLAEEPVVEAGSFRKEYLELPPEVLATSMAKHLKLFSVHSPNGEKLLNRFLAVLEGKPAKAAAVVANIERILEARFVDARFFYQADTKGSLEGKVPHLQKVVFHEKLGTVGERIPRLERLMKNLAGQLSIADPTRWELERVARVAKADLVTQMVREFPSLQGIIGGHYAKVGGDPVDVTEAIAQQYQPRTANDPIPSTALGTLVSLADRLDTLIGYFGVGLKPTGSADPYSLRRQAMGLVRILIDPPPEGISFVGLSIDRLFDEGIQSWGSRMTIDPKTLKKELHVFLEERFEWLAFVRDGIPRELIAAVLTAGSDDSEITSGAASSSRSHDLAGAWERLKILQKFWTDPKRKPVLIKAAKVAERTGRIVKAAKETDGFGKINPEAFKESSEKKLWAVWNQVAPKVQEQVKRRQYREAITSYSALYPEVHEFFETVFVMDENLEVRKNRLAFMKEIFQSLSNGFADLSKLPLAGIEPS
ncbi:MAG: glycine--tRNA ligase subunit beta [Candidatus Omnitrophica bacterium]|nr:glycine--tRNA ligase subunit beta [Candidatus Omnitrophota bacterium]